MSYKEVEIGDVVQLDPEHFEQFWAGQLIVVTEVRTWGVQGYVTVPDGTAFIRARIGTFERIGRAAWVREDDDEE